MKQYIPTFDDYLSEAMFTINDYQQYKDYHRQIDELYEAKVEKSGIPKTRFTVSGKHLSPKLDRLKIIFIQSNTNKYVGSYSAPEHSKEHHEIQIHRCTFTTYITYPSKTLDHELTHYFDFLRHTNQEQYGGYGWLAKHNRVAYFSNPMEYFAHIRAFFYLMIDALTYQGIEKDVDWEYMEDYIKTKMKFDDKYMKKALRELYKFWSKVEPYKLGYTLMANIISKYDKVSRNMNRKDVKLGIEQMKRSPELRKWLEDNLDLVQSETKQNISLD